MFCLAIKKIFILYLLVLAQSYDIHKIHQLICEWLLKKI